MSGGNNSSQNTSSNHDGNSGAIQVIATSHAAAASTFMILIILLTVFGNVLVILAFKKFRTLRQVTNYFVVSLAVTDILVAVFAMPVWVAHLVTGPQFFAEKTLLQILWTLTEIMLSIASIWHLTFVSIDRCLCITNPFQYHTLITTFRANVIIATIWVYSILSASLAPIFWKWEGYNLVLTILNYGIPVTVILYSYVKIFRTAHYQAKQIDMMINGKARRFSLAHEVKAAKVLGVVIGAFIVCWSPFFALNLIYYICKCPPSPLTVSIAKWMHYVNSMLNPIIYGVMNKDFRSAFKKLVTSRCSARRGMNNNSKPYLANGSVALEVHLAAKRQSLGSFDEGQVQ